MNGTEHDVTEQHSHQWDESSTVEVNVFRDNELIHTELCESDEQAALVVEEWSELDGVRCEVDDLTVKHEPGDILAPEPALTDDEEDYPPSD